MKNNLGFRIKELRKEKGLTQSFVAKELGYKYSSIISEIESGKKSISSENLFKLAKVLDVDINVFFEEKVLETRTNSI